MGKIKKVLDVGFSLILLGLVCWGLGQSGKSQQYRLKKIEIVHLPKADRPLYPVISEVDLLRQMGTGFNRDTKGEFTVFLSELNLDAIRTLFLQQSWVQEVRLEKRFPSKLIITLVHRVPKVILQSAHGSLSYVDEQGHSFGHLDLVTTTDLPLLSGRLNEVNLKAAMTLLQKWEHSQMNETALVSSVIFDEAIGFRFLVTYPLMTTSARARTMIHMGQELDEQALNSKFFRLAQVVKYLSDRGIAAHQIWSDEGKKVVVKIVKGS